MHIGRRAAPDSWPSAAGGTLGAAIAARAPADGHIMLVEQGAKVELESRADFARFVDQEIVRWNAIAKAANIQLE